MKGEDIIGQYFILKLKNSELSVDFIFKDSENQFSSGTFIK